MSDRQADAADAEQIQAEITALERRLAALRVELQQIGAASVLSHTAGDPRTKSTDNNPMLHEAPTPQVDRLSPPASKIALFRQRFAGRPDGYALRWTRRKTGKTGWSPKEAGHTTEVLEANRDPAERLLDLGFIGALRPEQAEALRALEPHDQGVLVAPPGAGKTAIACALIARRRCPTAVVVHRAELVAQWRQRLTQFLDIGEREIGQLGGGRRKRKGRIDIVMLQSLSHRGADPTILNEYGLIVIDECHALGAPAAAAAVGRIEARHWLGLTATPYRAGQLDDLITMQCGPIRHQMVLAAPADTGSRQLIVHETTFTTQEDGLDGASIQAMYGEIAADPVRNAGIVSHVIGAYAQGRTCLVLSNRIEHVHALASALRDAGAVVHTLHGQMKPKERRSVRERLGAVQEAPFILLAIDKIAGEGLDLPALDTLFLTMFLTMPVSFKGRIEQQLGRVTRSASQTAQQVEVHDHHDRLVPLFDRMQRRRQRVMERQGFLVPA